MKCKIRKDLRDREIHVPVGNLHIYTEEVLEYKWEGENFKVLWEGVWENANSIDFEFYYSSEKQKRLQNLIRRIRR